MESLCSSFRLITILIGILIISLLPCPGAAQADEDWVAKIVSVQGTVLARRSGENNWVTVKLNDTYGFGDMLKVHEKSRAGIILCNNIIIRLDQRTTITLLESEKGDSISLIELLKGAAHFFSRSLQQLRVNTPFVNAAVDGTEFFIRVEKQQTLLSVFEGQVSATNKKGRLLLADGQSAIAMAGHSPVLRMDMHPRDAVRWVLYYPSILYYRTYDFINGVDNGWQAMVQESMEFYRTGNLVKAFSSLAKVPGDISDPRYYNYRAALLLTVGRVDEAALNIEKALSIDSANSYSFLLKSIIALAQNQKDTALGLAQKSVELDPDSSPALIALSFAEQAHFKLQSALTGIKKAIQLDPENGQAWSRLAELRLSVGDIDGALDAAQEAMSLNPDQARTHTVLGFACLAIINTKDGKKAFEKAIRLDQAAPLPRLGLGLAKIREGDLKGGRREIEIAASLDPNNSLIRSYMGKAYYEEKRSKLALRQLSIAKKLDPEDPTPYFYDAILKQTMNRPVEALQDLQKSIELNDNRAVYRSRLLLDQDLAARSAGLARIYNDLGFQQLALVEGWKSLNTDPGNYSAHRFLADSYSALPRHEIARSSEILQSQLLQPVNITPVPPQLAEAGLQILKGT
ncbi:MAG: FecR domain-containing protein, partial [Desulfosarcina sp.]|nr:FecR domain-containing protein [Desulfobacterales bacterium]